MVLNSDLATHENWSIINQSKLTFQGVTDNGAIVSHYMD